MGFLPWMVLVAAGANLVAHAAESGPVDFARQIQPILIKPSSECHGPDKQKNNLRLDRKADAFKGGKSGWPGIVSGKSAESELIKRITTQNPEDLMPPKGEPLTAEQIELLRKWIDQGADWPEEKTHWAFVKPTRPAVPDAGGAWARNDIDRFIFARLKLEQLSPSPEADRITLLRRLSLDLTGLPPTLEEVEAFSKDDRTNAYERAVDRTEIYLADELFFVGNAAEITPVTQVDGQTIGDGAIGPVTRRLRAGLKAIARGTTPEHAAWRTVVGLPVPALA